MFSMRIIRPAVAVAAATVLLFAQGASAMEEGDVFKDASRVAAIGGPITEIVYALGEEARLVARDSTSVFPEAALQLPDVGYMRALSPEGVLSVNPTAILALHGSGPKEAVDVLKKASVQYIEVPDQFDRDGILLKIRVIGKALGADAKAETLAAQVDAEIKAVEALTKDVTKRKRVLFILSMQGGKLLAAGTDTAAAGIIAMAGGVNAVEGFDGYKQLSDESAVTAMPDLILMMDRAGDHAALDSELLAHPAIIPTPAGQAKAIKRMDGAFLLGFGPRTAAAAHDLAKTLYGDQIKD